MQWFPEQWINECRQIHGKSLPLNGLSIHLLIGLLFVQSGFRILGPKLEIHNPEVQNRNHVLEPQETETALLSVNKAVYKPNVTQPIMWKRVSFLAAKDCVVSDFVQETLVKSQLPKIGHHSCISAKEQCLTLNVCFQNPASRSEIGVAVYKQPGIPRQNDKPLESVVFFLTEFSSSSSVPKKRKRKSQRNYDFNNWET